MKLFVISNESIECNKSNFYCDNKDTKTLSEGLSKKFEVALIARFSKKKKSHKINIKNIKVFKNIFAYLWEIYKSLKLENSKYLIVSITPFTFLACILIRVIKNKPIVYLRSDGYKEYRCILGFFGPLLYHLMFLIVSKTSQLVACNREILRNNNGDLLKPSQLNQNWFKSQKKTQTKKPKLLYVGRFKKEKGIFSLLDILKDSKKKFHLDIVGCEKKNSLDKLKSIKIYSQVSNERKLIKFYDNCNIFVLPSYTEGHPMVLLEALSRGRPVIVFKDIKHVVRNYKGVFVIERNKKKFFRKVEFILKNYKLIQAKIKKNNLPTNYEFINNLSTIINYNMN